MSDERTDFVVGDDREPEPDRSGLYQGLSNSIQRIAKTQESIDREIKLYGKDPEHVDKNQLVWLFSIPELADLWPNGGRVWSGTFFGEKAKATDIAAALLGHRPGKHEAVTASQLWDKPCQLLVEYDPEKGRNKIAKVMPPKRLVLTHELSLAPIGPVGPQEPAAEAWGLGLQQKPEPAPDKLAAAAKKMAGASEPEPPDDAYMQALAEREEADAAEA